MSKLVEVKAVRPSSMVDVDGAVDADIAILGVEGQCTLIPDEHGGLCTWGQGLDYWLSRGLVDMVADHEGLIDAIVDAVEAARA